MNLLPYFVLATFLAMPTLLVALLVKEFAKRSGRFKSFQRVFSVDWVDALVKGVVVVSAILLVQMVHLDAREYAAAGGNYTKAMYLADGFEDDANDLWEQGAPEYEVAGREIVERLLRTGEAF